MIGLSLALLLRFLVTGMCGLCHAPEHAYDELNDHPEINRDDLCRDAHERLLMARTPYPDKPDVDYQWGEVTHAWISHTVHGPCTRCGQRTWKYAAEWWRPQLCLDCGNQRVARAAADYEREHGAPAPKDVLEAAWRELPRKSQPFWNPLRFSEYEVRHTRDFEGLLGPRYWTPRFWSPYTTRKTIQSMGPID
ncbi:MAG TPA: hypothetical protein VFH78_06960 [Candidatus Thermoplasmatota archaeon]|nr:hypothetical protein [Candidatus Thermoplasmatota archaeon]